MIYCSVECRNIGYKGRHFSPNTEFYTNQKFSKERNEKISKAHKGKYYGKRGNKDYRIVCKVCKKVFIAKRSSRTICDKTKCQKLKTGLRQINSITEANRRIKLSKRLKGRIPKNLLVNIKSNNSYKQYDMFLVIKNYFSEAVYNFYLKTEKSFRILDVAIPRLKLDFEYNGKVHLMKNVQEKDRIRREELNSLGWKIIVFDRINIGSIDSILSKIKQNGDVY